MHVVSVCRFARPLSRGCCYNNWLFQLIRIFAPCALAITFLHLGFLLLSIASLFLHPFSPNDSPRSIQRNFISPARRLADLWRRIFKVNKTFRRLSLLSPDQPLPSIRMSASTNDGREYISQVWRERCWKTYLDSSGAIHDVTTIRSCRARTFCYRSKDL